jgi:DNA-directed RNA polymerase subunit RPC12/RpoP
MRIFVYLLEEESMGENRTFTCLNNSCRKIFTVPLKTLNLQQDSTEPYYACPYCLTKITEKPYKASNKLEKAYVETAPPQEKPVGNKEKPPDCRHHLGYLSERAQKEQIPDECMVCKDIIECMLRKMRV